MAINLTDSLNAATTKGKLGDAKQVFLNGDTKNLQQAHEETNAHLGTLDNRSTQMENAIKDISVTGGASIANAVSYDNSTSGLEAVNAQGALDEIQGNMIASFKELRHLRLLEDTAINIQSNDTIKVVNAANFLCSIARVKEKYRFRLKGYQGIVVPMWATLDINKKVVRKSTESNEQVVEIEEGEYYLVYNTKVEFLDNSIYTLEYPFLLTTALEEFDLANKSVTSDKLSDDAMSQAMSNAVSNEERRATLVEDNIRSINIMQDTAIQVGTIGKKAIIVQAEGYYSGMTRVYPGYRFKLSGYGGTNTRMWATLNENEIVVRQSNIGTISEAEEVEIEEGEYYLVYNTKVEFLDNSIYTLEYPFLYSLMEKLNDKAAILQHTKVPTPINKPLLYADGSYGKENDQFYSSNYIKANTINRILFTSKNGIITASIVFYDKYGNFISSYGEPNTIYTEEIIENTDFPEGTSYIKFCTDNIKSNSCIIYVSDDFIIDSYEDIALKPTQELKDLIVSSFSYVFNPVGDSRFSREYAIELPIEGLLRYRTDASYKGGSKLKYLASNKGTITNTYNNENQEVTLVANGYNEVVKTFSLINVAANRAKNKQITFMVIGDSIAASTQVQLDGSATGAWNYQSAVKEMSMKDNIDYGNINIINIGTKNNENRKFSYKNNTYPLRSFSEGVSGFSSYTYLQFPVPMKVGTNYENTVRLNSETAWYALGLATETPFDSDSASHEFTPWSNTKENRLKVVSTPFGRYKTDVGASTDEYNYVKVLWDKLKQFTGFTMSGEYSGTEEQKAAIQSFFDSKMDNPDVVFYDKSKARAYVNEHEWSYDNAFSLEKYLSRYRTLDDNGNRLVGNAGETVLGTDGKQYVVGTEVNDVNDYDVCKPKFVFVGLGTNDANIDIDIAKSCIDMLMKEVASEGIKVGWGLPRRPYVFYNNYSNLVCYESYGFTNLFDLNELMIQDYGDLNIDNNITYIPIFNTESVYGNSASRVIKSFSGEDIVVAGSDNIHPSIVCHYSMAQQILAWLYLMS